MLDRTGQKVGQLTVTEDTQGAHLFCVCDCGREGSYPRDIFKPSYSGSTACPYCLGTPCEVCGAIIPKRGGMPAKTCSEKCRKERANQREKARYEQIKDTEEFKRKRAEYLERLAHAMDEDPQFAEAMKESRREIIRRYRRKVLADPQQRERYRKEARRQNRARLEMIRSDPREYEEYLKKMRRWYDSLTEEDYKRIFGRERQYTRPRKPR